MTRQWSSSAFCAGLCFEYEEAYFARECGTKPATARQHNILSKGIQEDRRTHRNTKDARMYVFNFRRKTGHVERWAHRKWLAKERSYTRQSLGKKDTNAMGEDKHREHEKHRVECPREERHVSVKDKNLVWWAAPKIRNSPQRQQESEAKQPAHEPTMLTQKKVKKKKKTKKSLAYQSSMTWRN